MFKKELRKNNSVKISDHIINNRKSFDCRYNNWNERLISYF